MPIPTPRPVSGATIMAAQPTAQTTAAGALLHAESVAAVLGCLRTALDAKDWQGSAAEVVSEIGQRLKCLRVSIGWVVAGQLRIVALSDGVVLAEGQAIPELNQAMLEAVHQHTTLSWPQATRNAVRITLAHQSLFKVQGLGGVVSVPSSCTPSPVESAKYSE